MDGVRSRCDLHRRWHIRRNRSVRNAVLANRQQIKAVTAADQDRNSPVITPGLLPSSFEAGSTVRSLAPRELLFRQGDPAVAIYKVESGRLRLIRRTVDDHLVILHTARHGEFFAEASLFADAYHCDAVAAAQSIVWVYQKEIVIDALRTDPALAEAFMARLARQLQELRARMELRNIRSARDRVLQYLRLRAGTGGCMRSSSMPRSVVMPPTLRYFTRAIPAAA